jgi:hypothetical protein
MCKKMKETQSDIKKGDIVLAQTFIGGEEGFADLKYKVTRVYFDEMENKWKAKIKGIDLVGKNINYSLNNLKKI